MMITTATIIAAAGAFTSGFGTGSVALGIWLHAVSPAQAASLVIFSSVVAQAQTIPAPGSAPTPTAA